MRTRVKICGITRAEDAFAATRLGADAIGMVFYPASPRNVSIEQARALTRSMLPFTTRVGLFVDAEPEFVAEVCGSSASYDLHVKKDLYEEQHVDEYLAVLIYEQEIRWHRWDDRGYQLVPPDKDGIWHSTVFPGLWLDGKALLSGDLAKVLAVLQKGLDSPEHAEFVQRLTKKMATEEGPPAS